MSKKVFIDGEYGSTGLQIRARLMQRKDIELLSLKHDQRRNAKSRARLLHEADIAILCLPDDAACESVELAKDSDTRIIDASTAHRTHDDWVFGFAELESGHDRKIAAARSVSNPGCYSTGAIALISPLIMAGLMRPDYPVAINAVSGYTGGGKRIIAQMENRTEEDVKSISSTFFSYSLDLKHKHIPEIIKYCGLRRRPVFTPSVGRFAQGMLVQTPLFLSDFSKPVSRYDVHKTLNAHYNGQDRVQVVPLDKSDNILRLDPEEMAGTDIMKLFVFGDAKGSEVNLVASLDNLGKGAAGAAIQNLDLMLESP